jgi:hypothetical protein
VAGITGRLGRLANVTRQDTAALSREVPLDLAAIQEAWPGRYLRLRLVGDAPGVYGQIAAAFDELFEHADHDPTRPLIEFYRREGEIDCLVPVNAARTVA